jgi:hypothetical protein
LSTGDLRGGEVELAHDLDAPLDGPGNGAGIRVDPQHPLYLLAVLLVGGEVEDLPDPPGLILLRTRTFFSVSISPTVSA